MTIEDYKPLNDVVVIKNDGADSVTGSGLYIPSESQDEPSIGTILGYGSAVIDADVQTGRKVVYKKYAGHRMTIEGQEVLIVPYEDLLLIEKEK